MPSVFIVQDNQATYDEACIRTMIDALLHEMHYDDCNYGTNLWNPLSELISPGDKVVIKPNLVMHRNRNKNASFNALECLVTQTPCIKVICDYCLKALNGVGQVVIGDAPMQGCNFDELVCSIGLKDVVADYQRSGHPVALKDFREYQAIVNEHAVRVSKEYTEAEGIVVHLGEKSLHSSSSSNGEYQVSDYDIDETKSLHHGMCHDYIVAKDVLEANVIINFCKPKTHRLAGFTGAMKNIVGCTYNKACLPHRSAGSVDEGGDAYRYKSVLKRLADWALTQKVRAENGGNLIGATAFRYLYGVNLLLARKISKDSYFIGSWNGNDTIWRTVCDLNYIVRFAGSDGQVNNISCRKVLNLGDMIISGEGNGPVSPTPKYIGALMASEDAEAFDLVLCKLMGFGFAEVPLARYLKNRSNGVLVTLNGEQHQLDSIAFPDAWRFMPHDSWR